MSKIEEALAKAKQTRQGEQSPVREEPMEASPAYTTVFQEVMPSVAEENRIVALSEESNQATEQYRILRTQILQKTEGQGINCLMVTSALDGEGKSTLAANLAISIAKEVHRTVLLVDADLRRPSLHGLFGLKPKAGLIHYLLDNVPIKDLLIRTGVEKLTFLPAGGSLPNSTEILRSPRMQELIREVKARYHDRYVIFDTSPLLPTADPMVLSQFMDGVILVVRAERTARSHLAEAMGLLKERNVMGVVMNGHSQIDNTYKYY